MRKVRLQFSDVPTDWALCFNKECPLHAACLRFEAGKALPDNTTAAMCVTPKAGIGSDCKRFRIAETITVAAGFKSLFNKVKHEHYVEMRRKTMDYLGGETAFYRYRNGKYRLSPEQQEWIHRLFGRYGYTGLVEFDEYHDEYRFFDNGNHATFVR